MKRSKCNSNLKKKKWYGPEPEKGKIQRPRHQDISYHNITFYVNTLSVYNM